MRLTLLHPEHPTYRRFLEDLLTLFRDAKRSSKDRRLGDVNVLFGYFAGLLGFKNHLSGVVCPFADTGRLGVFLASADYFKVSQFCGTFFASTFCLWFAFANGRSNSSLCDCNAIRLMSAIFRRPIWLSIIHNLTSDTEPKRMGLTLNLMPCLLQIFNRLWPSITVSIPFRHTLAI